MKYFLCSDFSAAVFPKIHALAGDMTNKHVLLIATAGLGEGWLPDPTENITPFEQAGAVVELYDLAGKSTGDVAQKIDAADIIYVSGGNTFYLLDHMRKTDFKAALATHHGSEKVYIGSSAGSIVVGADIGHITPMDDASIAPMTDYTGLGFVNALITPHFKSLSMPDLANAANKIVAAHHGPKQMIAFEDHQIIYIPNINHPVMRAI